MTSRTRTCSDVIQANMEKGCWLGVLIFAVCFGSWHAWSVVRVGRGQTMTEEINQVPEKDLDKVRDNGTAKAVPKETDDLIDDEEYEELYSDASSDDHELTEDDIDAIFNKTEEQRKIRDKVLMDQQEQEERVQEAIRDENEESLETLVENAHIPRNISMKEFALDLENITNAEHGPSYAIHLNKKMFENIPEGMTLQDFEDYVQEEEEEEAEEEYEEEERTASQNEDPEDDTDDLLYEEPDITPSPKDNVRHEYVLMDVYENFTEEETGKVDFELDDFIHDKSLNETAMLKEKGLFGHEKEWNETFID